MTNETSAERVQRRWDEGAPERAARRERVAGAGLVRRTLIRSADFIKAVAALALLAGIVVGLLALAVWFLIVSGGIILKFAGAVLIVVIVSMAWQQIRGH